MNTLLEEVVGLAHYYQSRGKATLQVFSSYLKDEINDYWEECFIGQVEKISARRK